MIGLVKVVSLKNYEKIKRNVYSRLGIKNIIIYVGFNRDHLHIVYVVPRNTFKKIS